jgi:hypothetical protein
MATTALFPSVTILATAGRMTAPIVYPLFLMVDSRWGEKGKNTGG